MKITNSNIYKMVLLTFILSMITVAAYLKLSSNQRVYKFKYFNTIISINLGDNESSLSSDTLSVIDNLLKSQEDKWFPKPEGGLAKLNEDLASGKRFRSDNETIDLINKLKDFYKSSNEYFNPTIGKLITYWDNEDSDKSLNLSDYLKKLPKPKDIIINDQSITSKNPLLQLNINGVITAHVLTQVREVLLKKNIKDAEISMGNDLYIIKLDNETNYRIVEKSTSSSKMSKLVLKVFDNEFLSTSGIFVKDTNNIVRTIINPKTGKTAAGFYGSTVIDSDPYKANVASIALIIAGKDNYEQVAKSLGINDYILYTYDNKIIMSESMRLRIA